MTLLYLILGSSFATIGDVLGKIGAMNDDKKFYFIAYLFYCVGIIFFFMTLRGNNLAIANAIFIGFNTITLVIASHFYFHEYITSVHIVAIAFIVLWVIILQFT